MADANLAILISARNTADAALRSVTSSVQALSRASATTAKSVAGMGHAIGTGSKVAGSAIGHLTGLSSATKVAGLAASTTGVSFTKMASAVAVGEIAARAFVSTARGLGDLFKTSVNQAGDFEAQLSAIGAVSGATAKEMATLKQLSLDLGAATSFSATEAAQGIEELVKAGVSIKDIMGGAGKASLDLAAAGAVSVADAAEIAANALNVFGLKGADMAGVADQIAGAANASAIGVMDFKFSLAAAGAVAATAGLSFDDLTVAIAEMGQAGIKGSDAGTSLKAFISGLTPNSKAAASAMKDLGLITKDGKNQFFDATGKMKSMAEIQGILAKATAGLTEQQKLMAFETIFGSDAIRAASVLAKEGAGGFKEMAAAIGKVSADTVAEKRLDNLWGSVEKFKGSLSTAAITIGMGFLPALRRIVDAATTTLNAWMPAITAFAEKIPAALDQLIDKALEFWPVIKQVFSDGTDSVPGIVERVSETFAGFWETAKSVFGHLVSLAQAAFPMVKAAFFDLLPVVIQIGTAFVTNLGETIRWLVFDIVPPLWSIIRQTAVFFLSTLLPASQKTGAALRVVLGESLRWLADVGWPALLAAAKMAVDWLTANVVPILPELARQLRNGLGAAILWIAETGWPTLVSAGRTVTAWITDTAIPTITSLVDWWGPKISAVLTWVTQTGWPMLVSAATKVSDWITGVAIPALTPLVEWLGPKLSDVVSWLIDTGWPTLVSAARAVTDWVTGTAIPKLTELWDWLGPKLNAVVTWLMETGWPLLRDAGIAVSDWITGTAVPAINELWTWLEEKTRPVVQWFIDEGWPLLASVGETVRKMFEGTVFWAKELWSKLEQQGVWADLRVAFSELWDAGRILVETFWPDMQQGAKDIYAALPPANTVLDALVTTIKVGSTFIMAFAVGVKTLAEGVTMLKDAAQGMPDWMVKALQAGALGPGGIAIGTAIGATQRQSAQQTVTQGSTAALGAIDNSSRASFVKTAFAHMLQAAGGDRNLAEMMLAKAISENGDIGKGGGFIGNNFSGIKGVGSAGSFTAKTWEMVNGKRVEMDQQFAAFNTPQEGMAAFIKFLQDNKRYAQALQAYQASGDVQQLFRDINIAGYATDPNWAATVENIRKNQVEPLTRELSVATDAAVQLSDATAGVATSVRGAGEACVVATDSAESVGAASSIAAQQFDAAAQKADEMAAQARAVALASGDCKSQVDALSSSLGKLPDWFTPTGGGDGGLFKIGKRALGGPVTAGMPYIVGERGPEMFVPSGSGRIDPNNALGGGGPTITFERGAIQIHGTVIAQQDLETAVAGAVRGALSRGSGVFG